jgi:hypothetical protein
LTAQHCPDCQHDLSNVSVIETKIKQQIELPPVQPFVTEYQLEIKCLHSRSYGSTLATTAACERPSLTVMIFTGWPTR